MKATVATEAIKWADKTMVEKVCNWLYDTDFDIGYWSAENGFCKEEFINDFKRKFEE